MPTNVIFPKVSLEIASGRISRWLAADGATVSEGQVVFEIDNDKAAVEVEAESAGIIRHLVDIDREVGVGEPVARIYAAGEPRPTESTSVSVAGLTAVERPVAAASAAVVRPLDRASAPNPTPLARRLAREYGFPLERVSGTGPRGRVQKRDVLAELAAMAAAADTPRPSGEDRRITPPLAFVSSGRAPLNALWLRQGKGLPLVMLHGFSGDLNSWRSIFTGGRSEWPALALDLPGHGRSSRATPDTLDEMAELVEATLCAEGIGPLLLTGHSFGGALATRIASRGQVDVRGVCLFAPAGLGPQINDGFVRGVLRASQIASLRPWLELLVHDPAAISDVFVKTVLQQHSVDGLRASMQAFADRFFMDGTQCVSINQDLRNLVQPVRVVFGRQDRILPFATTRELPDNVALHAVDACGHMPHVEKPGLALRILSEVWRSV